MNAPDPDYSTPANWAQPYYPPAPPAPVAPRQGNGLAVAALVLGITSMVFWFLGIGELAQVVLAIVFGSVGIKRANRGLPNKGLAIAGLVCGILGAVAYLFYGFASLGIGFVL